MRTRSGQTWAALALLLALCGMGSAAVPAGAADRLVTTNAGPGLDAFLGTFAWPEFTASGESRLVLFSKGRRSVAPVRVPTGEYLGQVHLGPDRHGAPVAAYSRCSNHPPFDCDPFVFDLRSGREHKVRSLSTKRCVEGPVAVWGRRYLFARTGLASSCRRTGLFLSSPRRRVFRGYPGEFDLRGQVAAITDNPEEGKGSILVEYLSGRGRFRKCVVAATRQLRGDQIYSPVITRRYVYWVAAATSESEGYFPEEFLRRRIPSRRCRQRGPIERLREATAGYNTVGAIAATGGRVFYVLVDDDIGGFRYSLFEMTDPLVRDP